MTDHDQVRRLLREVPYLRAHDGVTVDDVAVTFGVSRRQVIKDLELLWMCGLPGGLPDDLIEIDMDAARGEGVIRLTNADYLPRPLRFTPDEATSLIVALKAVQEVVGGALAKAADRAAAKLQSIVPEAGSERVGIQLATAPDAVRETLGRAIERHERLALEYDNASRDETTHPVVDPALIEVRDGAAYLHAWSLERSDWRLFRLDRIASVRATGEPAVDHGDPPRRRDWLGATSPEVSLDLAPEARWVVEYYPTVATQELDGGVLRARFRVGYPGWVTTLLLRLGGSVRRVEPPEAADEARARARAALDLCSAVLGGGE